jgi:hypothetical protein
MSANIPFAFGIDILKIGAQLNFAVLFAIALP